MPSVLHPKSKPEMLTPAYLTLPVEVEVAAEEVFAAEEDAAAEVVAAAEEEGAAEEVATAEGEGAAEDEATAVEDGAAEVGAAAVLDTITALVVGMEVWLEDATAAAEVEALVTRVDVATLLAALVTSLAAVAVALP